MNPIGNLVSRSKGVEQASTSDVAERWTAGTIAGSSGKAV
jgi:hypothetical protein